MTEKESRSFKDMSAPRKAVVIFMNMVTIICLMVIAHQILDLIRPWLLFLITDIVEFLSGPDYNDRGRYQEMMSISPNEVYFWAGLVGGFLVSLYLGIEYFLTEISDRKALFKRIKLEEDVHYLAFCIFLSPLAAIVGWLLGGAFWLIGLVIFHFLKSPFPHIYVLTYLLILSLLFLFSWIVAYLFRKSGKDGPAIVLVLSLLIFFLFPYAADAVITYMDSTLPYSVIEPKGGILSLAESIGIVPKVVSSLTEGDIILADCWKKKWPEYPIFICTISYDDPTPDDPKYELGYNVRHPRRHDELQSLWDRTVIQRGFLVIRDPEDQKLLRDTLATHGLTQEYRVVGKDGKETNHVQK